MAPIEPDLSNSNVRPALLLAAYATVNGSLLYIVLHRSVYRAYRALAPAFNTRGREDRRRKQTLIFQALAYLSACVACYYGMHLLAISYQVWAYERGEPYPTSHWDGDGHYVRENPDSLKLGRWLKDTDLLAEIFEIALDRSRRRWWAQQWLLGSVVWSTYAAIEGRRRNIPHVWAYVALSVLISLPLAQNLFFLAILLSPAPLTEQDKHGALVPTPQSTSKTSRKPTKAALQAAAKAESALIILPERVRVAFESQFPPKPVNWMPRPFLFTSTFVGSVINTIMIAFAANTPSFHTFLLLWVMDLFLPHIIMRLAPLSWGSMSGDSSHAAQAGFKVMGILSAVIYATQSLVAVLDNSPQPPNRYYILPQHQTRRERLAHPGFAISRVLGSLSDHPAVGRIAWEVLLTGVSLVVWASVRGTDASRMLRATGWVTKGEIQAVGEVGSRARHELSQLIEHIDGVLDPSDEDEQPSTPKKGHARKTSAATKKSPASGDAPASPTTSRSVARRAPSGEEMRDEDWEAGALGWGMLVLGGLGIGSTAILGAEFM